MKGETREPPPFSMLRVRGSPRVTDSFMNKTNHQILILNLERPLKKKKKKK